MLATVNRYITNDIGIHGGESPHAKSRREPAGSQSRDGCGTHRACPPAMTDERERDADLAPETEDEGGSTPPHPSQAEGADEPGNGAERPPRPSQAEGDREPE